MPIAALFAYLAANPAIVMAVPGAVMSITNIVRSLIASPMTPEEAKAALEHWVKVLDADVVDLPNVPKVH